MIGNSAIFLIIVFSTFIMSLFLKAKKRISFLAFVSVIYGFYLNHWLFSCFIVILSVNYCVKLFGNNSKTQLLALTGFHVFLLVIFKMETGVLSFPFNFILPVGFSIFIFQQITFIWADKKLITNRDFDFSAYLFYSVFFANIATGPLLNFKDFARQIKGHLTISSTGVHLGVLIFLMGFFKKIVFADSFGTVTFFLFETKTSFNGNLLIPFLLNKYEIYINFMAYSEMAIGIALIFGIKINPNFNRPFATTSIVEFWKRWHMTLIAWIREYVFYPLVISPLGKLGAWFLVLITFVVVGLWHDFTLNYFVYGLIQFVLVFLETKFMNHNTKRSHYWKHKGVVLVKWTWFYVVLISIPALIFRSSDFKNVQKVLENLSTKNLSSALDIFQYTPITFLTLILLIVLNELLETRMRIERLANIIQKSHLLSKVFLLLIYLVIIFYFGQWTNAGNFIYSTY